MKLGLDTLPSRLTSAAALGYGGLSCVLTLGQALLSWEWRPHHSPMPCRALSPQGHGASAPGGAEKWSLFGWGPLWLGLAILSSELLPSSDLRPSGSETL